MKHVLTLAFLFFLFNHAYSQVKIGGNPGAPDLSAVLELDGGSTRGLLLPRMRKLDMQNMQAPAEGLTVYITDEQATYLRRQNNWLKLSASADAFTLPYTGALNTAGPILSLSQTNNVAGGVARFQITGADNDGNVLEVINNGAGFSNTAANAGYFSNTSSNTVGSAILAETNSTLGNSSTIHAINSGTAGIVGRFESTNSNAVGPTLTVLTKGNGNAIFAASLEGYAPTVEIIGNNFSPSLFAWKQTSKFGAAAGFRNSNSSNTAPVVTIKNEGTGPAIEMDGINPQITLQQDDVSKGFVQLNGDVLRFGTLSDNATGEIVFRTAGGDRMFVTSAGNVLIGGATAPAGSNKLAVKGSIAASAFNVVSTGAWPDYVFEKSYQLKTLEETESFIKINKHLPNIPAAADVQKNGFELGDMQKRMMEKIEELTLHLIEANKRIKSLEEKQGTNK